MDVRNVIAREGREAKNLLLYHLSSEDEMSQKPSNASKKPPPVKSHLRKPLSSQNIGKKCVRVRSASTGRDKRSELQARYWALLFDNLQRAINEIYHTVECYENLSSCQETILVLENYIRDFRALAEWFQVSWDYDATPEFKRPQSLAWEVRKSNPAPRLRAPSISSPSPNLSGKSSPSYSGKSSPCSTQDENKLIPSPRKKVATLSSKSPVQELTQNLKSPRLNVREFILSKSNESEIAHENVETTIAPTALIESELTKIPEENQQAMSWNDIVEMEERERHEQPNGDEFAPPLITCDQFAQTTCFQDENLTLQQWRDKYENDGKNVETNEEKKAEEKGAKAAEQTKNALDAMETEFLEKNVNKPNASIKTINAVSDENPIVAKPKAAPTATTKSPNEKAEEKKVVAVAPMKYSNVVNRSLVQPTGASMAAAVKTTTSLKSTSSANKVVPVIAARPATATRTPHIVVNSNLNRKVPLSKTISSLPNRSRPVAPVSVNNANRRQLPIHAKNVRSVGPVPANTANRLASRSKTMIDIGNKSNPPMPANKLLTRTYETNSLSRDSFGSSTSTLRASNEQIANGNSAKNSTRKSEPRTMPAPVNAHVEDNDGWLTVKTKRRSSLHWSNRFNQPTGYASLPTLTMLDQNEKESSKAKEAKKSAKANEPTVKDAKPKETKVTTVPRPKANATKVKPKTQPHSAKEQTKPSKSTQAPKENGKAPTYSRATILQRQKSDVTGLKISSLHREYLHNEKQNRTKDETKDEEKPVELASTGESFSSLSSVMSDLYASCMDRAKHAIECDDREEIESDENQRKLIEEQECLERQILELQNTEIEIDTETDDADCETILEFEESDSNVEADSVDVQVSACLDDEEMSLETRYQHLLSDLSSGERTETLATIKAFVSRHPGRAQELHQKLSSPSRRRSLHETMKKYQAKQARAQNMRELLSKEKTLKIQMLLTRVEDVKAAKHQLIEEKRIRMEEKLQRYAENRNQYLKDKVRKAHDEEEKLKEIAFIKSLEAQNKRLDLMEMHKEQEGRLQDLEQERQKRMEEKAAKEAAVERRRMELARERQMRLDKLDETRREREHRVEQMQEEKEKLRQKIARAKARDREERLLALQVQQQQTTEELQRKIIQKQQESARRHEENIEHIRQRALELSIPSRNVDENGRAESSEHGRDDLSSVVSDVSIDQSKAARKKLKKLRQRLSELSEEYSSGMDQVPAYMRRDSNVPKLLALIRRGGGPQGIERQLTQLALIVSKPEVFDFQCLWLLDGLGVLANIVQKSVEPNSDVSRKALITAVQVYRNSCSLCPQIARHAILGNSITILLDALLQSLQIPDDKTPSHPIELSTELMLACTVVLSPMNTLKQPHPKVSERLPDLMSYVVCIGLIDYLSRRCTKIREPIESHQSVVLSILACLGLLTKCADIFTKISNKAKFLAVVKSTDLCGTISLLYATVVPVGECIPPRTISLAAATFNLILTLANLDLNTFQTVLSQESLSMHFIDVASILLKYCVPKAEQKGETQAVIVDLVATLGFFCANNERNQNLLLSDQSLLIFKNLSKLSKAFDIVVYPTLMTIICDNDGAKSIIGKEFDMKCIEEFQNSDMAKKNKIISMLKKKPKKTENSKQTK